MENNDTILAAIGTLTSAVVGGALWLRRMKPTFAKDDLATKAAEADIGVIDRLERECKRLAEQNDRLAISLNDFQMQILKLHTENNKLSMENNTLRGENLSLREEIVELRSEVAALTRTVMQMRINPA